MRMSIEIEVSEEILAEMQAFLAKHKAWNQDTLGESAIALFLLQNGDGCRASSRAYLNSLGTYGVAK